jgi:ectoine hydroxylase-related dioxygenase (phytanoyl-CoA dioxygenase family)
VSVSNQVSTPLITPEQVGAFEDEGFFVLESVLPSSDLELLRSECQRFIDERDREMDRQDVDVLDLDHRGRRYFVHAYGKSAGIERFLRSDLMVEIARSTLGDTVYLFNEQYVVKAAEHGMKFSWHQDSGFVPYRHRPYLACWITLDDVSEANGTVYLLPFSRAGTRDVVEHVKDADTNDMVGYFGDDPGEVVIARREASPAFRARSCIGAAQTTRAECVAFTWRSTPPSRF